MPASATYIDELDEDGQVDFKGKAKAFVADLRLPGRRSCPTPTPTWEKLSIFLNFLIPKLPAPKEEDLSQGHPRNHRHGQLPGREEGRDARSRCPTRTPRSSPCPSAAAAASPSPNWTGSRNILKTFNEQFGTLFTDADRIVRRITDDIAPKVAADQPYQNAKKNTPNAARSNTTRR